MGKENNHYSKKGGHFVREQAAKTLQKSLQHSPDGRLIRPNDPPRFPEVHTARRTMRRISQSGK